jgi:hypothetical protein
VAFQDFAGLSQVFEVDEQGAIGECANHKQRLSQVVEAVGIEEVAVHPLSRIDGGISRTNGAGRPAKSRFEPGLGDDLGTNVPRILTRDELLAKIRSALSREGIDVQVAEALVGLIEEALRSQARQPVARWCFRLP